MNHPGHLDVDTSDVPPIPTTRQRKMESDKDSPYHDLGNPWSQEPTSQPPLPPVLQAGNTQDGSPEESYTNYNLSSSLRAGHADQVTPRSSLDSHRSKDFWEDEDDLKDGQAEWAEEQRGNMNDIRMEENGSPVISGTLASEPVIPVEAGIRRKPVPSPLTETHPLDNTSIPLPQEFASNNPFRRESSAEHIQEVDSISSTNAWSEVPQSETGPMSPKGKGREIVRDLTDKKPSGLMVTNPSYENRSQSSLHSGLDLGHEAHLQHPPSEDLILLDSNTNPPPPPPHPTTAPPPIPQAHSPPSSHPPLIAVSGQDGNPWSREQSSTPSGRRSDIRLSQYNDSLLDREQESGVLSLRDELSALPNAAELDNSTADPVSGYHNDAADIGPPLPSRSTAQDSYHQHEKKASFFQYTSQQSDKEAYFGLDDEDSFQAPEGPPPVKPPRPSSSTNREEEYFAPPEGAPPTKPPRPAVVTTLASDEILAKTIEQRNETYQIKHFNWFDHRAGSLRPSSMLTQNKNGPCPLLALVNALILGVQEDSQAALDNALRAREQVTLGLIIETLIDELISSNFEGLPDVDELNRFLFMLHTGMNANPRFVTPAAPAPNIMDARNSMLHLPQATSRERKPGDFEPTQDMKLYRAFSVPLIHGWLPSKRDPAWTAFSRSAQTYEDAQALQFGEEELEYKLSHGGLIQEEQRVWEDIISIKNFLKKFPTQLTPYGLEVIQEWLLPGQFAIMFRNDHFSTIYKHPESGKLFTLITDAGYADRDEIVWESLTDHSGASEFFSGDFRPVGGEAAISSGGGSGYGNAGAAADPSGPRRSSQYLTAEPVAATPISPQERQEQHDADFAMALQLQDEEEQRANQNRRRPGPGPGTGRSASSQANIPIRLRPPEEVRPAIPPRTSQRREVPAVNRPVEEGAEDTPPTYEEAAKGRPYIPPVGSEYHPATDPSPSPSARTSVSRINSNIEQPPPISAGGSASGSTGPRRLQPRRQSAYGENSSRYQPPGAFAGFGPTSPTIGRAGGQAYGVGAGGGQGRRGGGGSGQDRDCIVM